MTALKHVCRNCNTWKHSRTIEQGPYNRILAKHCSLRKETVSPSSSCGNWTAAEKDRKCINCIHIRYTEPQELPPDGVGAVCELNGWIPSIRSKKSCASHVFRTEGKPGKLR